MGQDVAPAGSEATSAHAEATSATSWGDTRVAQYISDTSLRIKDSLVATCHYLGCSYPEGHTGPHRDPWWDTLVALFGYTPTGGETGVFGRIVNKARAHPPEVIVERAHRYYATWPDVSLTPTALDKWWDWLGSPHASATEADRAAIATAVERDARRSRLTRLPAREVR